MQKPHWMQLPREVIVGYRTINKLPEVLSKVKSGKHILILTGKKTKIIAGDKVNELLVENDYSTQVLIVKEASMNEVKRVINQINSIKPQIVLGVGGGKIIDVAKFVSFKRNIPYISVPTTASHDGIASPRASIKGADKLHSIQTDSPL
ncbi:MAG: iron-containing alcohol dehydrogenase, partial [Candidatus Odinarchaeia archaeon]